MNENKKKYNLYLGLFKDKNFIVLFSTSFIMIMGSQLMVSVIPEIMRAFKINEGKAGLIISCLTFPTIILSPIFGKLAGTYGRKKIMIYGTTLFGIAGFMPAILKPTFNLLLFFRIFQGIGFAATMPLTVTLIGDLYEGKKEVAAQGFRFFFIGIAAVIFPILGGSLATVGWYFPFYLYLSAILFALLIFIFLSDTVIDSNQKISIKSFFIEFNLLKDKKLLMILMTAFIRYFLTFSFRIYLPVFIFDKYNSSLVLGGILVASLAVMNCIASFQSGLIADKFGMVKPLIFGFFAYSLSGFLLPLSPNIFIIFLLTIIIGIGDGLIVPFQKSLVTQNVSKETRATIVSFNSSVQSIGKTISPLVGIIIVNFGFYWAFWFMSLISLFPFLYFLLNIRTYDINDNNI